MKPLNAGHILLLVVIGIIAASYLSIDNADFNEYNVLIEKSFELDGQKELDIDLSSEDVIITTEDTQTFKIVYSNIVFSDIDKERIEESIVIREHDNEIQIYKKDNVIIRDNVFKALGYFLRYGRVSNHYSGKVTVVVPEEFANDIKVDVSSGDVQLSRYVGDNVQVDASSGEIYLEDLEVNYIKAKASSGDINITSSSASEGMEITTSSGEKLLKDLTAPQLKLDGSSGDVHLSGTIDYVEIDSSSGEIYAEELTTDKFVADGSSGSISFKGEAGSADIQTSSGEIYFDTEVLEGDYKFEASSGSIHVTVPDDEPFLFESNTSSGDFNPKLDLDYNRNNDDYSRGHYLDDDTEVMIEMKSTSGEQYLKH